jgi:hypothetical protein
MDGAVKAFLAIAAAALLVLATAGIGVAQTTEDVSPNGAQVDTAAVNATAPVITHRVIEERENALGEHPVLTENSSAHDPSYGELMDFLKTDDTVNNKYDKPNFTCADFAVEMQTHAECDGIQCGYASFSFMGKESGHAVDVFNTVDEGLVYVDATGGKLIITNNIQPGERYYNLGVIAKVTDYW